MRRPQAVILIAILGASTPSGREYVRVVDYGAGQFTLIAKSRDTAHLDGQRVQLRRDREGGLSIKIDRGISR